jgi:6-phosphogluconate dehydrogenase
MNSQIGVIGLAVMGKNLALNIAEHGFNVAVYNRSSQKTKELLEEITDEGFRSNLEGFYTLEEFVASLESPRRIIMMVKAGDAVDDTIRQLLPLLSRGDLLMDGGNSFYEDTIRRSRELKAKGILYLGTGISGGEEGARRGPAIMPGGDFEAYQRMEEVLTAISAKAEGEPCSTYIGENGSGHFVKMVHNGIEYADMQLIAEAYDLLRKVLKLNPPELQNIFEDWNKGELNSYLIGITADIFGKKDAFSGDYLVNRILDVAGQKGTGKWTGQISLDLGVPTPSITEAVYVRYLSSMKGERNEAARVLQGPVKQSDIPKINAEEFIEAVRRALYAGKICAYAQGFDLLKAASEQLGWKLNYGNIARIFRGGCIIRAQFLNKISAAYERKPDLSNLLMEEYFADTIQTYQKDWRGVIVTAVQNGISIPAFTSALAYYDGYRSSELPMNLLQAQRDYFGAHTYERRDRDGIYHTNW